MNGVGAPAVPAAPTSAFAGTELPEVESPVANNAGQSQAAAAVTDAQPGPATKLLQVPHLGLVALQKSRSEEIPRHRGRAQPFKDATTRFRLESKHGGWEGSSYLQVTTLAQCIGACICDCGRWFISRRA